MAGDTWYHSNKTQPSRDQPWYHILVHDSGGLSTYVAQSNLKEDTSGQPVSHPRIQCYFSKFQDGRYHLKATGGSSGACGI
jgi:heat shock protein HspQ